MTTSIRWRAAAMRPSKGLDCDAARTINWKPRRSSVKRSWRRSVGRQGILAPDPCTGGVMSPDRKQRVLVFVEHLYEDLELWYPRLRLIEAGMDVVVAGPEKIVYAGKNGYPCRA